MTASTMHDLFPLIGAGVQALASQYQGQFREAHEQAGLSGDDWHMLLLAQGAEPLGLTFGQLQRQMPYGAAALLRGALGSLAECGMLEARGDSYHLSERGRAALAGSFSAVQAALAAYEPLPPEAMARTAALLERIVAASVAAAEPAAKPDLLSSRRTDPGPAGSAAARIDQYLTDLLHFRDDAHRAAWQPLGIAGGAWEIFTLLWRGDASERAGLQQRAERRGYTPAEYDGALAELAERGWIARDGQTYSLTERGRALREQAEETTDRYFYTPWATLGADELAELHDLLARLRDTGAPAEQG